MSEGTMEMLSESLDKNDLDLALMSSPYEFPKAFYLGGIIC